MKTVRLVRRLLAVSIAAVLLGLNLACVGPGAPTRQPVVARIWPSPPEVPRISFENALSRPADMGIEEGVLQRIYRFLAGTPETPLVNPHGLTADAQGRLYVVDAYTRKIHVYDRAERSYQLWPATGKDLVSPIGITIDDARGRVYVSDSAQALVRVFSRDKGEVLGEIRSGGMGRPTGMAVNPLTDELLVVDTANSTILRFALADHGLRGVIGREGIETGQ
ncbi:MAG: hypothetical protein K0B16_03370, partial [Burkholderiaceae bacterium]|nr:hypothetical protein [Burkholderiaceae bacterium]